MSEVKCYVLVLMDGDDEWLLDTIGVFTSYELATAIQKKLRETKYRSASSLLKINETTLISREPCFEQYTIWGEQLWETSDWYESGMSERYDDCINCTVDFNDPTYPENDYDKFMSDMLNWWSKGEQPSYAYRC